MLSYPPALTLNPSTRSAIVCGSARLYFASFYGTAAKLVVSGRRSLDDRLNLNATLSIAGFNPDTLDLLPLCTLLPLLRIDSHGYMIFKDTRVHILVRPGCRREFGVRTRT